MKSKKPICAKCGRPAFKAGFCESHWIEKHDLFEIKPFSLKVCENCGRWFDGKWHPPLEAVIDINKIVMDVAKQRMRIFGDIDEVESSVKKMQRGFLVKLKADGKIEGVKKIETRELEIPVKMLMCDNCIKVSGSYHEAVIQVRGSRIDRILRKIEKLLHNKPGWVRELKYGWDIYFVNKADARAVVGELKEFEIVSSYKLVGKRDGRNLYRDFYVVR